MQAILLVCLVMMLIGCASTYDRELAAKFCAGAGYEPQDADYPDCIKENVTRYRQENLRKNLEIARNPSQQYGIKFFYNGPTYGRPF
jgi:hypothetical protein